MPAKILAFSGSSRKGSLNKKLLAIAVREARALGAEVTEIDLRDFNLPIYDGDIEGQGLPEGAVKLQEIFKQHNALLICTPEYNGGVAPLLKNSIDWVSRPHAGAPAVAAIMGKTVSILSAAIGILGGSRQQAHLRVSFQVMRTVLVPETVNIPLAGGAFNEDGSLKDKGTHDMVVLAMKSLKQVADKLNP
ncbi:MAG: NAD(P)H-dependent oxidoreductase [Rhodospirillaceae bacterium]|nr:NAD(P)H-dependent oxidoreductase [Rhodospirillaceae bacterium]